MAYKKISDLTAVTTPATTDLVEIEQSGTSYKATVAQITGAPNGGQPPAPKPRAATDSDIGQWVGKDGTSGNALSLPTGGTWAYLSWYADDSTGLVSVINRSIAAGGTEIQSASSGKTPKALVWRIS